MALLAYQVVLQQSGGASTARLVGRSICFLNLYYHQSIYTPFRLHTQTAKQRNVGFFLPEEQLDDAPVAEPHTPLIRPMG